MDSSVITPYVIPESSTKPRVLTLVPNDPGSRYKTRQLQIRVVGKSKMIKTLLTNILDVAKDMQVPPNYIGTFMGYVIGAQAKFDNKKQERQQAFLSGEHEAKDLSKIMLSFINEVLLCPVCGLPEILLVPEKDSVFGNCRACGGNAELKINDAKFKRFIINHPPTKGAKGDEFKGNKAGEKTEKKSSKRDKEDKEGEEKPAEEKVEKPKKSKKVEEEIVWHSDTSQEAIKKRREDMLPKDNKGPTVEELTVLLQESLSLKEGSAEAVKQLKKKSDDKTFVTAFFNTQFGESADLATDIKKSASLAELVNSEADQLSLLASVEKFLEGHAAQLPKLPLILKDLYDRDLLEEGNILAWSDSTESAVTSVREVAAPMIKWLKEAEEEDSGEDEEEEEDD